MLNVWHPVAEKEIFTVHVRPDISANIANTVSTYMFMLFLHIFNLSSLFSYISKYHYKFIFQRVLVQTTPVKMELLAFGIIGRNTATGAIVLKATSETSVKAVSKYNETFFDMYMNH